MGLSNESKDTIAIGVGLATAVAGIALPSYGAYRNFIETPRLEMQVDQEAQKLCGDIDLKTAIEKAQDLQFIAGPKLLKDFQLNELNQKVDDLKTSGVAECYGRYRVLAQKLGVFKIRNKSDRRDNDQLLILGVFLIPGAFFTGVGTRLMLLD